MFLRDWETWAPLLFLGRDREEVGQVEIQLARFQRIHYPLFMLIWKAIQGNTRNVLAVL